ncbi:MAG: hypothetical protein FIB01_05250 [Gemmatimonadetes bacterium]|nr:hypothetical protein [Gemmatimonadota bacterium]
MATVELTRGKVKQLLTDGMGLRIAPSADAYCVDFTDASTRVRITVRDWLPDPEGAAQTVVVVEALVLQGVRPTPALYEWVAREGRSKPFGHIEVHDDRHEPGTVFLMMTHTLLGDQLDKCELETAVWGVLFAADCWDDELQRRFGGRRAKDARQ